MFNEEHALIHDLNKEFKANKDPKVLAKKLAMIKGLNDDLTQLIGDAKEAARAAESTPDSALQQQVTGDSVMDAQPAQRQIPDPSDEKAEEQEPVKAKERQGFGFKEFSPEREHMGRVGSDGKRLQEHLTTQCARYRALVTRTLRFWTKSTGLVKVVARADRLTNQAENTTLLMPSTTEKSGCQT